MDAFRGTPATPRQALTAAWALASLACAPAIPPQSPPELAAVHSELVIGAGNAGSIGNQFGYEGGTAIKVAGVYHLFLSEMIGPPLWDGMRFGHWTSSDRVNWTRQDTVLERRNAWSPMVIWDDTEERWNLFYIQYRWERPGEIPGQHDGTVLRLRSSVAGREGLSGPFDDLGVVMRPGPDSAAWEGQQGTDSFFPYRVGKRWLALYGSHDLLPGSPWLVGTATANTLAGPWTRLAGPLIDPLFIENPVVTRQEDGALLAVYDSDATQTPGSYLEDGEHIGVTWSRDGLEWHAGKKVAILPPGTARDLRTPLGLIDEGDGRHTLFFTVRRTDAAWWDVGFAELRRR